MVALKAICADFVAMFTAALVDDGKAIPNLHAFNGVDAHQRMRQIGIKTIKHRLTEAWWDVFRHDRDFCANRVALFLQSTHQRIQRLQLAGVRAEKRVLFHDAPVFQLTGDVANLRQITPHHDTVLLLQIFFGDSTGGHAHGGFAR